MRFDWPTRTLEECLDALIDYRGKTPTKTSAGIPLVTAKVIKNGRIEKPTEFISTDEYDTWMRRGIPLSGDVVLTTEAPLGEVAQLGADKIALAQRVITLRGKKGLLDSTYLLYLMQTEEMQSQLKSRATGTTVLGIKQSELRKISVRLPPIEQQLEVASVLSALDKRMDLIRATNMTLESIAQALFKSWFVDFDPVRAKAEGREPEGISAEVAELFPDSMAQWLQESRRVRVGELCSDGMLIVGDGYRAKNSELGSPGVSFVRGGDLLQGRITPTQDNLSILALPKAHNKMAIAGDTAFTSKGTIGRFAYVDESAGEAVYSPQVCFWRSLDREHLQPAFLHFWMRSALFSSQVDKVRGQAAIMDFVSLSDQRRMLLDVPQPALQRRFAECADPILNQIASNRLIAQTLSGLRDSLLPRLISGQLRLPEAEALLRDAA